MILQHTGNVHAAKDINKAALADYFIGIGCPGSSTQLYAEQLMLRYGPACVNTREYTQQAFVFISINGNRTNRVPFSRIEPYVRCAMTAGCSFITDNSKDRNRFYNIGEREVASFLISAGYRETNGNGIWHHIPNH